MSRTPVIYLHGFASSPGSKKARYFRDVVGGLIVPDLAEGNFERLTITGQLQVIARAAAGKSVSLIGSSLGGYLAALYAARHPEVDRVVLMAPAFAFAKRWADRLGPELVEKWRRTGLIDVFHYGENRDCRLGYQLLEDAKGYEDYPDISQPTLIFHGAQDDVVPAELSEHFASAHPNAHLEVLPSGHELLNVLEVIGNGVREFLETAP